MARFESLSRCLTAAGGVALPGNQGTFFLYSEDSTLVSKEWTGNSFGHQELIASSVLPSSVASYLITPQGRVVICISSTSTLRAVAYDEEEGEWVDDEALGLHKLHPKSKVSGVVGGNGGRHMFFQDPSKRLIHLDNNWAPTVLPVNAVEGSPLATVADGQVHVFYISARDGYIHSATQQMDGSWSDAVFAEYAFEENEKPVRFMVSSNDQGALVVFALTEERKLLQLSAVNNEEAIIEIPWPWGIIRISF